MLKVLIADDEKKICQLIQALIDWKSLGLDLIGFSHNGAEALQIVKSQQPDILITDIRMPELSGLELIQKVKEFNPSVSMIIVSGYRQFEFAQQAIQLGAEDYLLKPIKKVELENALKRILDKKREYGESLSEKTDMELRIQGDSKKLRSILVKELVEGTFAPERPFTIERINHEYHLNMTHPLFMVLVLKLDVYAGTSARLREYLDKQVCPVFETHLDHSKCSYCYAIVNNAIYALVNYESKAYSDLKHHLRHILYDVQSIGDTRIKPHATIGIGKSVDGIDKIFASIEHAKCTIANRLLFGVDCILEDILCYDALSTTDFVDYAFQKMMLHELENIEDADFTSLVRSLEQKLANTPYISGQLVLDTCREIFNIFVMGLNAYLSPESVLDIKNNYSSTIDMCTNVKMVFDSLLNLMNDVLALVRDKKEQRDRKPIQDAKQYMRIHYTLPLTLEDVSKQVGFSPNYLSTLFKKETGHSFLEYLTDVRIQAAKKLLLSTQKNIVDIATSVGYYDEKYFSWIFKKATGLNPSEFRKLYY